jgi:hypothetical protein
VASFNRPGGNITGINDVGIDLAAKRLGLLHDMLPGASRFAALVDEAALSSNNLRAAAMALGLFIELFSAGSNRVDAAFALLAQKHIDALWVGPAVLFTSRRLQLSILAAYHRVPAMYPGREFPEVGGLMSYGPDIADSYRLADIYVGSERNSRTTSSSATAASTCALRTPSPCAMRSAMEVVTRTPSEVHSLHGPIESTDALLSHVVTPRYTAR